MAGFKQWEKIAVETPEGRAEAIAPVILSVSRATDVPAFYADWFMNRLKAGYFKWVNPFNTHQVQYVSTSKARVIVFWSKNPKPMLEHLDELDGMGIHYYFQFTLNDYDAEGYEPKVPRVARRMETFHALAERIGPERVIWRMDPLLLTDRVGIPELLAKADAIAGGLRGATRKLVFSYADITAYGAVQRNLQQSGIRAREFTTDEMNEVAAGLVEIARVNGITEVATCSEKLDQEALGVKHNRCVDDELMIRLWKDDRALMDFLGYEGEALFGASERPYLKDKGQRKECGCIVSKDIGRYGTCPHLCVYCYANHSEKMVRNNFAAHCKAGETIC